MEKAVDDLAISSDATCETRDEASLISFGAK